MRKNVSQYRLPPGTTFNDPAHLEQLNKLLQNMGDRLDTIQQIGAKAPSAPLGVAVQGLQGMFNVTWQNIRNVDSYTICWSANSSMLPILGRDSVHDSDTGNYRLPVGNVAVTYYFTVSATVGNQVSPPSAAVSATSQTFTTSGSAPTNSPVTPRAALVSPPRSGPTLP
jgi:hypothetical protein